MIKVYVAGAYSDNNAIGVLRNIGRGEGMAAALFGMGYAPYCPWHDKDFVIKNPHGNFTVKQFQDFSLEWLRVCNVVLIVSNAGGLRDWKDSPGTLAEIEEANKLNIPVVFSVRELQERFPVKLNDDYSFA